MIQVAFFYLVFLAFPVGVALAFLGFRVRPMAGRVPLFVIAAVHVFVGAVLFFNVHLTRNQSDVDETIVTATWDAVANGRHNSNTDLTVFRNRLLLIHQSSPYHLGTDKATLVIRESTDEGRTWSEVAEIDGGDLDIRDPKFLRVGDRLYLYVLMNVELNPEPFTTWYTWSDDGKNWAPLGETGHPEWLFWRARETDGVFYVPAYYYGHGTSILLTSEDGEHWDRRAEIFSGGRIDETAIAIRSDGEMMVTGRLEYSDSVFGHNDGATLIAVSEPPYIEFTVLLEDQSNRLDGPALFEYNDRVFAVGRRQPRENRLWAKMGSAFTRKRTSVFEVTKTGLVWLTDLPSAGDTSYPGVVVRGDEALVCYYTSNVKRDEIWFTGLLQDSPIRMATLDLREVLRKADQAPN